MGRKYALKLFFLLFMFHLVSAKKSGKNKNRISICPDYTFCSCYPDTKNRVEIYCFGTRSLDPIYNLLLAEFKDVVIKRLRLPVDCYLSSLPSYLFENFTIQRFSSSCPLSDIEPNAFMGMKALTSIDLINTTFTEIPAGLTNLHHVEALNISNHSLESLDNRHWNMFSLKRLSMRYGYLEELPNTTFTGMPNLQDLDLAHNQLTFIEPEVLSTLKILEQISLGYNFITRAADIFKSSNPMVIDLKYNNLRSLNNVVHEGMTSLQSLDVSGNFIPNISSSTFGRKLEKLKEFSMSHANCTSINMSFPLQLPRLKKVDLGFNKLHTLPEFRNHKNIGNMDLQFNSITCNEVVFDNMPRLRTLILDHNNISAISDCFGRLIVLETLQLSHNKIRRIEDTDFQGLLQIRTLALSYNLIDFIGSKSFTSLRYLQTLDLSHNRIHHLNGSLRYVTTLQHLTISSCYLQKLTASDFHKVQKITVLDLSNNKLTSVDGAFQNFTELSYLNLAENKLTTISRETFPEGMDLKELRLEDGNEWSCDCGLLWLFEWLSDSNYKELKDNPLCTRPRNQNGKKFQDISVEEIRESQEECIRPCHCECGSNSSYSYHSYLSIDCSSKNITSFPTSLPTSLGILNLSENDLKAISIPVEVKGLFSLNLEHNRIVTLETDFLLRLKELRLSYNMLERPHMLLLQKNSLHIVTLSGNPWICDCRTLAFRDWLVKNQGKVMDLDDIKCGTLGSHKGLSEKVIYLLQDSDLCPGSDFWLHVGLVAGFTCFVLASLTVVCSMYRHHLKSILYARGLKSIKHEDNDMDCVFDGFFSYNWLDEQFVFAKIVPGLQDEGENFDICIPNRDVYGAHSNALICQEMKMSKRILILLNQNYMNDENSMAEFRLAYDLCLEYKTKKLIFIKNEKIPHVKELDPYVKRALKSSVCIFWGEKFFWERLRYAMPKKMNDMNLRNTANHQGYHPTCNEETFGDATVIYN